MKPVLLFCSATLLFINIAAQDSYWPLNADANDIIGNNHGIPSGGVSYINDALKGQVLLLDGVSGYIQLPHGLLENVNDITIACWFNWTGGAAWQRVYSFGYSNTDGVNQPTVVSTLYLCPSDAGGNLRITLGGPYIKWTDMTPRSIDANKWYFSAFIKKEDSIIFYLNDKIIATDTSFLRPADLSPDSMNWIGRSHWADATFNGMIDDVKLYKSALTHAEVLGLYTPVSVISETINPAEPLIYARNGKIFIKINGLVNVPNSSVEVFNILGKLVYKTERLNNLSDIEFNNGIYLVKLSYNNKEYVKKLLINQ